MARGQIITPASLELAKGDLFKAEQQKFDALFYGAASPLVLFLGPEFIYEKFNEKYRTLYPERELLGKKLFEALPELLESPFPAILKRVYDSGEPYFSREGLARIYNPVIGKLEERYFDTTFSRISYGGDDEIYRIMATPMEVTERVQARKNLEISLRELEQERELREKFVSALTHDLRTPLSITKLSAQIIKRKSEGLEEIAVMADRVVQQMDRADRMIRDLLDANRIKATLGIPISIHKCRLDLIIEYVVKDLEELYGARFQIQNKAGEVNGYWDDSAIHRLIENLASNAIKYGSPKTPVIIGVMQDENWVEISVHNEGKPIPLEDQKSLFNHYQRTELAKSSGQKGWGIGLTLVRGLAEAHRGTVRIESSTDQGTTFTIRLPLDARSKT